MGARDGIGIVLYPHSKEFSRKSRRRSNPSPFPWRGQSNFSRRHAP